ncbi:MAG: Do family serine endopeptidase [Gammaproteobacteria bacterium]|nr:Do family serine endopeptidase [Gammaproteobacteria bacterium]MDD9896658.1 Do family serine endopeptidase [Gammaproteobacteria bacterium]
MRSLLQNRNSYYQSLAALLIVLLGIGKVSAAELPSFADLVEQNAPTIVEIQTSRSVEARAPIGDQELEELLRRLNPGQEPDLDIEGIPEMRQRGAVGSGFIISADGYVITNNHVVAGADEIQVRLNDRRVFEAEVIGLDEPSDLALLKLAAGDLPYVTFGDSDASRVGDWVLAIGSPFGLEFSAAAGIISAQGRSVPGRSSYNYMSFIQSDVAINQGNSGGPLFNLAGEVIGINSQILSSTGGSNGVSFSIPSNVALNVVNQLRESGHVERGLLGVRMRQVDYALAEIFGMDRPRGAFVDEVQPDSPASRSDIRNEDIILRFLDHDIEDYTDLPFYVGQYRPGTLAEVEIFRDGEYITRTVELGSSPTNVVASVAREPVRDRRNPLGFRVTELSDETRQVTGISGVRIAEIGEGPGRDAGLAEGDVIVALNRREVNSAEEFAEIADQLPESGFVPIRIIREGQGTTMALELSP